MRAMFRPDSSGFSSLGHTWGGCPMVASFWFLELVWGALGALASVSEFRQFFRIGTYRNEFSKLAPYFEKTLKASYSGSSGLHSCLIIS